MSRIRANPQLLALLLGSLAMLPPLAIDTFFPAFHVMEGELGVGAAAMQQTLSVYLLAYGGMSLLHGPLSDAYGRRNVILFALLVFAIATVGCALAPDLGTLLVFRVFQGMAGGAGSIIGRAIIRDCFEGADATRLMSQVTLVFAVAPALAPIFGGWVLGWSGWRSIFWVLAVFTMALLALSLATLPETHPPERRHRFSVAQLFRSYRSIVADTRFLLLGFSLSLNFAAVFTYIASAPTFVLDLLHLNERQFGWLFVPTIAGLMIGARLSARLAGRALPSRMVHLGYAAMGLGAACNLAVSWFLPPGVPWSVLPVGLGAIGVTLVQPTVSLMMLDRFPAIRGAASSLQVAVSLTLNSVISGLISPLISGSPILLAGTAALMSLGGFSLWTIYRHLPHRA
jgi:DHA1 family bicyclomycin/chloramphenicol resistance-like MFS transporter